MARPKLTEMGAASEALAGELLAASSPARAKAAAGDPEQDWFVPLVRGHARRVFGLLYRMVGNAADAQDLTQEVFLKAYERRRQLRDPARAMPWLLRIATNSAIDFQRARLPHRMPEELSEEMSDRITGPNPTPEEDYLRSERQRRLWAALEVLSPKERAAVVLRDLEGNPNREVAAALGCSMITVRTHIASARVKMRKFLMKEGRPQELKP